MHTLEPTLPLKTKPPTSHHFIMLQLNRVQNHMAPNLFALWWIPMGANGRHHPGPGMWPWVLPNPKSCTRVTLLLAGGANAMARGFNGGEPPSNLMLAAAGRFMLLVQRI
jgi:hypothetical protein